MPVNALLGTANLVLQAVEKHDPRAVVLCFGAEAAHYRVELYPPYHADRTEMPEELVPQWEDAPAFFGAFGWTVLRHETLEADDLLGALAQAETEAGGQALLFTGDRDMFQCVGDHGHGACAPAGKGEPEPIGPAEVRARYGVAPSRCPTSSPCAATRPTGCPAPRASARRRPPSCCSEHGSLDALLALPIRLRPRVRQSLTDPADELRAFRRDRDAAADRRRAPAGRADRLRRRGRRRARARR